MLVIARIASASRAGPFSVAMAVRLADFSLDRGEPARLAKPADSGRVGGGRFCRDCGTRLWHEPAHTTVGASTTVSANGRTLQKSSPVFFNDVVKTNATGVGLFVFDDGSKLAVGPSASVLIDKTIYKGKSAERTGIQATKGAFRYISGAFSGHSLATPYGTIGIRGTAFDFTIRNGKVYLLLYRGSVNFCGAR